MQYSQSFWTGPLHDSERTSDHYCEKKKERKNFVVNTVYWSSDFVCKVSRRAVISAVYDFTNLNNWNWPTISVLFSDLFGWSTGRAKLAAEGSGEVYGPGEILPPPPTSHSCSPREILPTPFNLPQHTPTQYSRLSNVEGYRIWMLIILEVKITNYWIYQCILMPIV